MSDGAIQQLGEPTEVASEAAPNAGQAPYESIGDAKARGEDIQPLLDEVASLGERLKAAETELLEAVYGELKRLARGYVSRERSNYALQPTELVNEAYLKLLDVRELDWHDRAPNAMMMMPVPSREQLIREVKELRKQLADMKRRY